MVAFRCGSFGSGFGVGFICGGKEIDSFGGNCGGRIFVVDFGCASLGDGDFR